MALNIVEKVRTIQERFPEVLVNANELVVKIFGIFECTLETVWPEVNNCAFRGNEDECFELLKKYPQDINKTTDTDETPLHLACMRGHYSCIKTLLMFNPELNMLSDRYYTPLNLYISRTPENEYILKKLLAEGADPNIADEDGYSPLHTLALQNENDKTEIFARLLLQYNADINSETNFNETPLHLAVYKGRPSFVKVLLDNGASFTAEDRDGRTPIDISFHNRLQYPIVYDIVAKHVIIEYCCGFQMNLELFEKVCNSEKYQNFKRSCEEELQRLKSITIGESFVTFYDICVLSDHKVAKYFLNPNIVSSCTEFLLEDSILGPIFQKKHKVALERSYVIKIGILAAEEMFTSLPDLCRHKLLEYLDIEDYRNLYEACFSDI